jgi:hypothetical protein
VRIQTRLEISFMLALKLEVCA